jgi:hypothetical protein
VDSLGHTVKVSHVCLHPHQSLTCIQHAWRQGLLQTASGRGDPTRHALGFQLVDGILKFARSPPCHKGTEKAEHLFLLARQQLVLPARATLAPWRANARAIANPIPVAPPVIKALLPSRRSGRKGDTGRTASMMGCTVEPSALARFGRTLF